MSDDQITPEELSRATAPQRAMGVADRLIETSHALAQVLRYNGDLRASAEAIQRQDRGGQPYPLTMVLMSNVVSAFLYALADAEDMRSQHPDLLGQGVARSLGVRPTYGPRRRAVE